MAAIKLISQSVPSSVSRHRSRQAPEGANSGTVTATGVPCYSGCLAKLAA